MVLQTLVVAHHQLLQRKESIKLEKELTRIRRSQFWRFCPQESWSPPPAKRERSPVSNVVSSEAPPKRKEHFSSVRSDPPVRKPKSAKAPVKRRAAKKRKAASPAREAEPEYEAKPEQTFEEDDDFSDFSL